uniref:protein-tyrosine-phosphatase n=1 Tax=Magallana gigas TaxID=29159 RepID=A0A8W8NS85_MAGGI
MKAQIANMSLNENAGFKSEYHNIPRGELHPCLEGKKQENKVKNRYTTIFPYDHSRVILKTAASNNEGYINANYIEDTREMRTYIATQGPKPKTIADFWNMIWQEDVCNIVCLTNLTEGTKNKCAQYWPDINDKLQGGTLTVRHLEEKTYAEYIIRRFKIHNKSTRTDRQVTMFHYTTWSDHGVADPLSLVVFHRHVIRATANSAGKYTVVHCSAGVGRTGTYIALDALYREGKTTGKINVPMYVRTMRKDRMNMIQGDDQYKLLYLALMDAFYGQNKCLESEKFLGEYQKQTCYTNCGDNTQKKSLSSELEELLSLRKEYTQQDYISGRAKISANYTESVLPVEEFMCHLYYIKGYNTYYNAVLIESYLEKESLISAQYPLSDNTEDFLRLIKDFDARVVVFLCPLKDIESTSKWFPPENQHKFDGIFYVKNMSSKRSNNVKMTRLNIQPTGFNEMDITLLECPTWSERLKKGDKRVLLDVVKAVKTEKSDQKGRVLVLSRDGATRCGPFFVLYNVLEQISVDREVDIFTAVRQIQIRRPECVSTVEEYQLCHDAIAEYLLNDCELLSLRKEYTQQDYISGRAQISANYTESVLPVEEFMCHLYYMKGYNTYYNAVLIQSYLEKDPLISAQYPLSDNTKDFLRLIKDFDARVVVFLCPLKDIESVSVDREVDIFTAVRQIQIRRPECVSTVEEYKLYHDAIAEFLLNDCVYGICLGDIVKPYNKHWKIPTEYTCNCNTLVQFLFLQFCADITIVLNLHLYEYDCFKS